MDSRIESLLEKYWKCETSLEEEKELKSFFNQDGIPDELKEPAILFRYFESQKKQGLDDAGFKKRMKSISESEKRGKLVSMVFTGAKIAAGVLVVVAATYLVRDEIRKSYPAEVTDTYSDPELAFEETKKALMMISKGFGKAKEEASKIKVFNEAEQVIQGNSNKKDEGEKINI